MERTETPAPIFGLRYLEEEAAEMNDIAGCNVTQRTFPEEDGGETYYTTNCDIPDHDYGEPY